MSDILSAEEVTALLRAFAQLGEKNMQEVQAGSPRVRNYDFTCPVKISYGGLRQLKRLHAAFASSLSASLSEHLKVSAYSQYAGSHQIPYRELWAEQPANAVMCEVHLDSIDEKIIVRSAPSIADVCLDILMGGSGGGATGYPELTSVDCMVFARVLEAILQIYSGEWTFLPNTSANLTSCSCARDFEHSIPQNEPMLVFEYEVRVANTVGTLSICIPARATSKIPEAPQASHLSISAEDIMSMGALGESVSEAKVLCHAILGRADITLAEIANLRPGDILALDTPVNSEVEFWVGGKPAYTGTIGRKGSKVGIKVSKSMQKGGSPI